MPAADRRAMLDGVITPDDRRAAILLLGLAAAGLAIRLAGGPADAPGALWYRPAPGATRPVRDSVAARAARLARPLARGETIDPNRASVEELTRLPRIGPALARRIVADRASHGPYATPADLTRVSGIGPAVLAAVRPYVVTPRTNARTETSPTRRATVMLNTATPEELAQLPGIGPRRAQAIVQDRRLRGPYRDIDDLMRVRGIGRAIVEQLRGLVSP